MQTTEWFTLQEYSNKYRVSISTLRRRIKSREIEYTFKNGRYLLRRPENPNSSKQPADTSFIELKSLYQGFIQEKNTEISRLKEEIADLNQLIHFLEKEKERLENNYQESDLNTLNP